MYLCLTLTTEGKRPPSFLQLPINDHFVAQASLLSPEEIQGPLTTAAHAEHKTFNKSLPKFSMQWVSTTPRILSQFWRFENKNVLVSFWIQASIIYQKHTWSFTEKWLVNMLSSKAGHIYPLGILWLQAVQSIN